MKTYSVLDFGAVNDGSAMTSAAIQSAIDACYENGGGEVVIPKGEYLIGDIYLHSGITLHLLSGAKLIASRDPEDYFNYYNNKYNPMPKEEIINEAWYRQLMNRPDTGEVSRLRLRGHRWSNAIIRAWDSENIAVIGDEGSVIDGMDCYDAWGEEAYRGPHGIGFFNCRNITLGGYTIQHTGNWAHYMTYCENITVNGITVKGGHDGIHMNCSKNICISDSSLFTGDDSIAGFGNLNVCVKGCELNSACSAFRFGATNALITCCRMYAPAKYGFRGSMTKEEKAASAPSPTSGIRNNMLAAYTYYSDFKFEVERQPGNIVIENCEIEMADRFLHFNFSGNELWQANRPLENITFRNIKAKDISMPLTAYGAADVPFTLRIENAEIGIREGAELTALIHAANCKEIELKNVKLDGFNGDTLVRAWAEIPVKADVVGADCEAVKAATGEFFAKSI